VIKNREGKVFYGLHFAPGVAEYQDAPTQTPYRILINADVAKQMDPSFAGKPLFVEHTDNPEARNGQEDGWVLESFFNQVDGFHWAKFVVITPEGLQAIQNGWTLSNAYHPDLTDEVGQWHAVEYSKVVNSGEYEHLALVPNPRYKESMVLDVEGWKKYNENKSASLLALRNSDDTSKGAAPMNPLALFKKEPVKNSAEILNHDVTLPKSKKTINIGTFLNEMDEKMSKNEEGMAEMNSMVKLHDGTTCNVGELLEKHKEISEKLNAYVEKHGEMEPTADDEPHNEDETPEEKEKRENEEKEELERKNAEEEEEKKKKEAEKQNALKKANALRKAGNNGVDNDIFNSQDYEGAVHTESDGLELGKKLF